MTPQMETALLRAWYGGILTGLLTALTTYQVSHRGTDAIIAGVVALVGYLLARGAAEGWIDSARNAIGDVHPSDVGSGGTPPEPPQKVGA